MFKSINSLSRTALLASLIFAALSFSASAQGDAVDILPPITQANSAEMDGDTTHDILRLTPDKSELIRLDNDAGSVLIGNPTHINIIADSAKTLVVVPREPGATFVTVLDKKGQVLMQRHVIVASPKEGYVRVKRTCTGDDDTCQDTSVYYCPDMCHETKPYEQDNTGSAPAPAADAGGNAAPSGDAPAEQRGPAE